MSKKLKFNQPAKLPLPTEKLSLPDNKSCNRANMIYPGYLEITDKVRFVYYKLRKPTSDDFLYYSNSNFHDIHAGVFSDWNYEKDCKAYEASKRLVEVSNVKVFLGEWVLTETEVSVEDLGNLYLYNNQPCKAEVNGKTAKIIELTR